MHSGPTPDVSVVVPVYNDPTGLAATLRSLAAQTYPSGSFEVVVVDNDSDDGTLRVAREAAAAHPELVRVERERKVQSSYAARNAGIEASTGELLAFVDADVTVDPDWLEAGVAAMADREAEYMGCRVDLADAGETLVGLYNGATGFPVERYVEENAFAPTCALFVARSVFRDVGRFDAELVSGGDVEFGQRVADSGRPLHYAPEVAVAHPARTSLRSLLSKRFRVGRGITQRSRRYPDRYDPAPLYHPFGFAPPHPGRFPSHFGDRWDGLTTSKKVGLYGVGYLERLAETAGRALEMVSPA